MSSSVGATLIAALVVQALPHATPDVAAPAPELTSGGKFAARVASAQAYDGLDTMPLPRLAPARPEPAPTVVPVAFLATSPTGDGAFAFRPPVSDGAPSRSRARPARLVRAPVVGEPRRPAEASAAGAVGGAAPESGAATEGGILDRVAAGTRQAWSSTSATTRAAWTMTASAGSALVSHIAPW